MKMTYLIIFLAYFLPSLAQKEVVFGIEIPNEVIDTLQRSKLDTTLNGLMIRQGNWYEYYAHEEFEVGKKTILGAYIKGIRQGNWLIYHDNMLSAHLHYVNGYVEGLSTFYLIHDDFYKIITRERTATDSLYDGDVFYKAIRVKPLRLQYILQIPFTKGQANGKAVLLLPNGEKAMEFICENNRIGKILMINPNNIDFELIESEIPFAEIWQKDTLLRWIEYQQE